MTLEKRLAALVAALEARDKDAAPTTEQLEEQVAQLVAFMGSGLFDPDTDVISEPTERHTGEGCDTCIAIYRQAVTVGLVTALEHSRSGTTDTHPISEREWRARGRWWPNNANITCLAPTFAFLTLED